MTQNKNILCIYHFLFQVPQLWAVALDRALRSKDWGFARVVISLYDPAKPYIYEDFVDVFSKSSSQFPVILTNEHGMLATADYLSETLDGDVVGVLNPSDVLAVRSGMISTIGLVNQGRPRR